MESESKAKLGSTDYRTLVSVIEKPCEHQVFQTQTDHTGFGFGLVFELPSQIPAVFLGQLLHSS